LYRDALPCRETANIDWATNLLHSLSAWSLCGQLQLKVLQAVKYPPVIDLHQLSRGG
jgi:hypothetical protein